MTNTTGFDPQHDARFQRGYDPSAASLDGPTGPLGLGAGVGTPTDSPSGSRAAARAADATAAATSGRESDREADLRADAATSVGDSPTEGAVDFARGTIGSDEFRDAAHAPRRNPFVIALWILSPLLLIGGLALVVQAASNSGFSYSDGEVPWALVLQQMVWSLAPAMLSTGLATIAGLLFWHAFAWHRARSAEAAHEMAAHEMATHEPAARRATE
jgi:hypothetical protein